MHVKNKSINEMSPGKQFRNSVIIVSILLAVLIMVVFFRPDLAEEFEHHISFFGESGAKIGILMTIFSSPFFYFDLLAKEGYRKKIKELENSKMRLESDLNYKHLNGAVPDDEHNAAESDKINQIKLRLSEIEENLKKTSRYSDFSIKAGLALLIVGLIVQLFS